MDERLARRLTELRNAARAAGLSGDRDIGSFVNRHLTDDEREEFLSDELRTEMALLSNKELGIQPQVDLFVNTLEQLCADMAMSLPDLLDSVTSTDRGPGPAAVFWINARRLMAATGTDDLVEAVERTGALRILFSRRPDLAEGL